MRSVCLARRHSFQCYSQTIQQREIEICELLQKHPHRNIAAYHGCFATNGRATGLCFARYKGTLLEVVNPQGLNKHTFMSSGRPLVGDDIINGLDQILDALQYMHSLKLVHNDVNPSNILYDKSGMLALSDFDSTRHEGESLRETATKRTHEWHTVDNDVSAVENDLQAFEELKTWLLGSVDELRW
ncbi:kinase-like domain-containing protein [Xylariales sp. PMI_506]|nr:kinase-like domain-containing protein [Xylariales sp. PMI_506]